MVVVISENGNFVYDFVLIRYPKVYLYVDGEVDIIPIRELFAIYDPQSEEIREACP